LTALTHELNDPNKGHLDAYLKQFVGDARNERDLLASIVRAPGLDGEGEDRVLGSIDDAELRAVYEAEKLKRKEALG
jgi:cell filamentation protein